VINNVVGVRILDVGCGYGKWGALLKKYTAPGATRYVAGVDLFPGHVATLRKEGVYDEVREGSALDLPFEDHSFDTVIACEVMEHLPPGSGRSLVAELRRVASACVIVTTPAFPCLRGGGETRDGYNPHEAHQAIYNYREFRSFGFTQIIGVGFLKIRPWRAAVALSSLGLYWPVLSRYLMGFWFADGRKRMLVSE
jgi:SAM-dependent methyltransferase